MGLCPPLVGAQLDFACAVDLLGRRVVICFLTWCGWCAGCLLELEATFASLFNDVLLLVAQSRRKGSHNLLGCFVAQFVDLRLITYWTGAVLVEGCTPVPSRTCGR